jgi:hypothetical protein
MNDLLAPLSDALALAGAISLILAVAGLLGMLALQLSTPRRRPRRRPAGRWTR